jgi:death-on-curing protein
MNRLTTAQILLLHQDLIDETGGMDGLRDVGLLDSALNAPFQTFDLQPLYPSVQQKAARLCHSIINDHPFIDGNKRIGIHAMLVFLLMNGVDLIYTQQELVELGLGLASGRFEYEDVLRWILQHQQES